MDISQHCSRVSLRIDKISYDKADKGVSGKIGAYTPADTARPGTHRSINSCHDVDGSPEHCSRPLCSLLPTVSMNISPFPLFLLQIFSINRLT